MRPWLFLTCAVFTAGFPQLLRSQTAEIYINNGTVTTAPQIDARNFVNTGFFDASSVSFTAPYRTYNTINYTNRGIMQAWEGFVFDTTPSSGPRRWADNFTNAAGANIIVDGNIDVSATNVMSRGSINAGALGKLGLTGKTVDLSRSMVNDLHQTEGGQFNRQWLIKTYAGGGALQGGLFDEVYLREKIVNVNTSYVHLVALMLPEDENVVTEVSFSGGGNFSRPIVRWTGSYIHPETLQSVSAELHLTDTLAVMDLEDWEYIDYPPQTPTQSDYTYQPNNYILSESSAFSDPEIPVDGMTTLAGLGAGKPLYYSLWDVELKANTREHLTNNVPSASVTNLPGRVEISATGTLNLNNARISSPNYLAIRATNHFIGNNRSFIVSPFTDIDVATTNTTLTLNGLIPDLLPRWEGSIGVESALWTHEVKEGDQTFQTNYHVLVVDCSAVWASALPMVRELKTRSQNLVIGDIFNVQERWKLLCENMTIIDEGALNLYNGTYVWSDSTPLLRNLTNYGVISTRNDTKFLQFSDATSSTGIPYDSFVNYGQIYVGGLLAAANQMIIAGEVDTQLGNIDLQFNQGTVTNAFLFSANELSLRGNSLDLTNSMLFAPYVSLGVTGLVEDGNADGENLVVGLYGFALTNRPAAGDFLRTRMIADADEFIEFVITWAGDDRGRSSSGFQDNAAVGELELDGKFATQFRFRSTGGTKAMYVENLILSPDVEADVAEALAVDPDMTVYFASLESSLTAAELESMTGGRFKWVSYAGARSSVSVPVRDRDGNVTGSIFVNSLLASSSTTDSDGDGISNDQDPFPFDGPVITTQVQLDGSLTLTWDAAASTTYSLWSTENLSSWLKVQDVTSSSAGPLSVTMAAPTNATSYKVSYNP